MDTLGLSAEEVLTCTRAVRRRLDLERPVPLDLITDCVRVAQQAPSGSNTQRWHFVVVTDDAKRSALADLYRRAYDIYRGLDGVYIGSIHHDDPDVQASQERSTASADHLAEHLHRVPALVIPCVEGRIDPNVPSGPQALLGSILPAAWSFMLAARDRGLGTAWTSLHLMFEEEAADLLGIPYAEVTQALLTPVAYYTGEAFRPAARPLPESIIHVDAW